MYLAFEFLFYLGLLALGIGIIWLLATLTRRRSIHGKFAIAVMVPGVASIAAANVINDVAARTVEGAIEVGIDLSFPTRSVSEEKMVLRCFLAHASG